MENRFGLKDFLLVVLLLAILASIWLAMKQFDRQHETLRTVAQEIKQQASAQARLERMVGSLEGRLADGVVLSGGAGTTGSGLSAEGFTPPGELPDPFDEQKRVRQLDGFAAGDWVVDAFPVNVAKLTPMISRDFYGAVVQSYVLETLAGRDPETLEWSPVLAETWKQQQNLAAWQAYVDRRLAEPLTREEVLDEPGYLALEGDEARAAYVERRLAEGRRLDDVVDEPGCPPALTITFRLRRGLTFSDGEPLTAHDVVFTYDLVMHPRVDAAVIRNEYTLKFKSVEALDDHTVAFRFKKPFFDAFQEAGAFQVMPEHFYGPIEDAQIDRLNSLPGLLLGSGPYKVAVGPTDWVPGREIVLERNDRYWGPAPPADRLVFKEVTSDVARLTAFRNGEIDLFYRAVPEQYIEYLNDDELVARSQSVEAFRPNDGYGWIAWNQEKNGRPTPFADQRVRRAMTMLIDRQRIVDKALFGYGMVPSGPFNELSPQHNPDVAPLPYDVEAARALLAEAGYVDRDGDGVVESEDGQPLRFKHTYPSSGNFWNSVSLVIKDSLAQAGVLLELDPLEWSVFSEKVRSSDFDAISMAWGANIETDIHHAFHSSNIGGGANNFPAYRNPELDALIDRARVTLDEDERMAIWHRVHAILNEDQPYTFLYVRKFLTFADGRFENARPTPLGISDRTVWYVPTGLQKY
ncbi:MAG: ABC transporter substrate-binding protein [Planctomycetota bacterium]